MYPVRTTQFIAGRLGQSDVADLARLHLLRDRADGVFDRHVRVDPVQVVEVDMIDAESSQRLVECPRHVSRVAVDPALTVGDVADRSEEHTSELQSLMPIPYGVFCLKK